MRAHPLFRFLLLIGFITGCVLLTFQYLLPLFIPFITAYILMRLLMPLIQYLQDRFSFPKPLAYGGTLLLFFILLGSGILLLGKYLIRQGRLLCTNASVYCQICSQTIQNGYDTICLSMDHYLRLKQGSTLEFVNTKLHMISDYSTEQFYQNTCQTVLSCIGGSVHFLLFLFITFISMIILCKDIEPLHQAYRQHRFYPAIHQVLHTMRKTGLTYLRAQLIILLINWFICSIGLCLIRNPYFILIGLGISLVDALPILGSGTILIPWGIYYIFQKEFYPAAILFTAYLITLFLREILEAKLMGDGMGMLSFFTLASIYAGLQLYGICGIFLGPFAVVLIRSIYQVWTKSSQGNTS